MPDLNQKQVPAVIFDRCYHIEISNPLNIEQLPPEERGLPVIKLHKERVTILDGKVVREAMGVIERPFNPAEPIPMRDMDGNLTGETKLAVECYLLLSSFFYKAGAEG